MFVAYRDGLEMSRFFTYVGVLSLLGGLATACATGNPETDETTAAGGNGAGGTVDPQCAGQADGTPCGSDADSECDAADTCLDGVCSANVAPDGAPCGDPNDTDCDPADRCDGKGTCRIVLAPTGSPCGDGTEDDCTRPDSCDGMGTCLENHRPEGYGCGDSTNNQCTDPDICDGAGTCLPRDEPEGAPCGDGAATQCTDPDTCDGMGTCLENHVPSGTPCGDQTNNACNAPDTCDGGGTCEPNFALLGTSCGSVLDTDCNDPDSCDGAGSCLVNFAMDGASCNDCPQGPGLCIGCSLGVCLNACIPPAKSLTTTFAAGNGLSGAMFDIEAKVDIVVTRLQTNLTAGDKDVSIWYIPGGKTGFELSQGAWTFVDTVTVTSAGPDVPTEIPIDLNLPISAGERYGFVVHSATGGMRYTNGTTEGAIYVQNVELRFFEGRGVGADPFAGFQATPRVWNGIVNYELPCP